MVKQKMARMNINILGVNQLKWMGMGKFNSDNEYIYDCRQESLRRNGVALIVNKRVRNAVLGLSFVLLNFMNTNFSQIFLTCLCVLSHFGHV